MIRTSRAFVGLAAAGLLSLAACSDDDQNDAQDALSTLVDEAEDAGRTAISEVGDAAGEATNDAVELAVRTLATQQGEEQFANAGHALDDGGLTCTATVSDNAANVTVSCAGTTEDGGIAELIGETSELPGALRHGARGRLRRHRRRRRGLLDREPRRLTRTEPRLGR